MYWLRGRGLGEGFRGQVVAWDTFCYVVCCCRIETQMLYPPLPTDTRMELDVIRCDAYPICFNADGDLVDDVVVDFERGARSGMFESRKHGIGLFDVGMLYSVWAHDNYT